MEDNGGVMVW